jgi:type IV pilus biogenesis protein CpaD/CtpE
MPKPLRYIFAIFALLSLAGCASRPEANRPPMTQAEASQQLQNIASDPHMSQTARAAAQQGLDEGQAKQMMEQGK